MSKAQLRTRFYVICVGVAWRGDSRGQIPGLRRKCLRCFYKFLVSAIRRNEERVTVKESAIDRLTRRVQVKTIAIIIGQTGEREGRSNASC